MKFKRNYLLTFILNFNSLVAFILTPLLMIMVCVIDEVINAVLMIPGMFIVLFVLTIFWNVINMLTWPFSKKIILINNNEVSYNNKSILLSDIDRIYFELGTINKTGSSNPCCLSLYKDNNVILKITHISFIALLLILKKCKGVPKRLMPQALYIG